jgi:hypothetical protein
MFRIKYKKAQECHLRELNGPIVFSMIYMMVKFPMNINTLKKMSQSVTIGGLWGDFTSIF